MLCSEYRSVMLTVSSSQIKTLKIQEDRLKDISFDTKAFIATMVECDKLFEQFLDQTLVTWNHYGAPLMPPEIVDEMIARVQKSIPNVWDILSDFRGLNTKNSRETRRGHLYKGKQRSTLFQLFALARSRNHRYMTNWAIIMSLSEYCRGSSKSSNVMANYFGQEVSRSSLAPTIVKFKAIMKNTHKFIVKDAEEFTFVFDNSQIIILPKYGTEQNASLLRPEKLCKTRN
eukprot:scaffold183844_cov41-Attheya_sp.AAC.1